MTLNHFDTLIFRAINQLPRHDFWDAVGRTLSSPVLWWGVALALVMVGIAKRRKGLFRALFTCLVAVGITDVVCAQLLKPGLGRERPCWQIPDRKLRLVSCGGKYGLPSNHAANGMAAVVSLASFLPAGAVVGLLGLVGLVGLSRVFLGVHYPGDVLLGFVVGAFIGWMVRRIIQLGTDFVKKRQDTVFLSS